MKYIKLFESMTEVEVEKICKNHGIVNWSINKDGLVDVDGDVNLLLKGLTKLPLRFGRVTGDFYCQWNVLTTLEGAPKEVSGHFHCFYNKLTSLVGAPKEVGGNFYCYHNYLNTLKWAPEYIGSEVDFLSNGNLPEELLRFLKWNSNRVDLMTYIFKWQKDYAVWRRDGSFNQSNFIHMMEAAQDELQNIKFPK